MPLPQMTTDEIIAVLRRSTLPNILVEGGTDASIYRWIEKEIGLFNGDIITCGGRTALLEIFDRRTEYPNAKTIFLADKDMWLFSKIPTKYNSVIWTEGYSIENDLLSNSFSIISNLFDEEEKKLFDKIIYSVSKWFAFEVEKYKETGIYPTFHSVQQIVNKDLRLCENFIKGIHYTEPQENTFFEVYNQFILKLRGKTLQSAITHILSAPHRKSKYSKENILELSLKTNQLSPPLSKIIDMIKYSLANIHFLKQVSASGDTK
ncbi:hypothetical protein [Paenibacillus sp. CF384]|uniref:hypothetical protein n=1 Tax=Paenibacillus sp. CF384 TaxID=1884382 RepID=UPI00089AF26A|nr:hypothetical protein [Paenibacillus sp. CF384]SDX88382.1 hypothetical protein SAMN05518855_102648 [Paenibacillus sp. CF384]